MDLNLDGLKLSMIEKLDKMSGATAADQVEKAYKQAQADLNRARETYLKAIEFNDYYRRWTNDTNA